MATPKKATQITLEMAVGDSMFLKIAKMAHSNNMTFNEQINELLTDAVNNLDSPKEKNITLAPTSTLNR